MCSNHVMHRCLGWVALVALAWASLFPTVSMALATPQQRAAWAAKGEVHEVCTAQGTRWVSTAAMAAGDASSDRDGALSVNGHPVEHCPYCSVHSHGMGLPPSDLNERFITDLLTHARPAAFWQAPHTLHAWVTLPARGPPQRS